MLGIALEVILVYALIGLLVGFAAGLLGIGGGVLMVPLLSFVFEWQQMPSSEIMHYALGTSMAAIVFTSIASLRAHHSRQGVVWPVVKRMGPGVLIGTFCTTFFAVKAKPVFLSLVFTVFIACVAMQMFFNAQAKASRELPSSIGLFATGGVIGSVSAMVSIAGGAFTVPFLSWCNVPIKKAIGTSAAVGMPLSIAGTAGYIIHGQNVFSATAYTLGLVYLPAAAIISLFSIAMAPVGARVTHALPVPLLKKIFSALLVLMALRLLLSHIA